MGAGTPASLFLCSVLPAGLTLVPSAHLHPVPVEGALEPRAAEPTQATINGYFLIAQVLQTVRGAETWGSCWTLGQQSWLLRVLLGSLSSPLFSDSRIQAEAVTGRGWSGPCARDQSCEIGVEL